MPADTDPAPPGRYRLTAFAVCHDLKCNLPVEVVVALPRPPTSEEAAALLRPAAEVRLRGRGGDDYDYQYELVGVRVADEPGAAADADAGGGTA